ncbi:unnamed protein product [Effrenium voratum]|nr:unnamed protein product [Effrenium voratum]
MASPSSVRSWPPGSMGSGSAFEQVAAPLASELLATLEQEHTREIMVLYEEQVRLREELRRVVDLMLREVLPRERQLHDMFDQLSSAFHTSAQNMRRQQEEFHARATQVTQRHDLSRQQLLDPLQEAEQEVVRIDQMLKQPLVTSAELSPHLVQQIQRRVQLPAPRSPERPSALPVQAVRRPDTCPKCGNLYADDANFCRRCGTKRPSKVPYTPASPVGTGARSPAGGYPFTPNGARVSPTFGGSEVCGSSNGDCVSLRCLRWHSPP